MKIFFCTIISFVICGTLGAQTPGEEVANKIAWKMKDSLQLTDSQRIVIYNINMQIAEQKSNMRSLYTGTDSLRLKIQLVEYTRDGLYHESCQKKNIFCTYKRKDTW